MNKRLLIVFVLGFSSGIPLSLVTSTLQAWFADSGMSIFLTSMLSLISLPYIFRVVWAPLLDRYSLSRLGKRRSWLLVMQALLCLGFNLMSWLSPNHTPSLIIFLALFMAMSSATQDLVIDAHRTEYLPVSEQGLGASLATFGYRLALLVAGGLALVVAQYSGWATAYRLMGCFMILGMMATYFSPEPSKASLKSYGFVESCIEPFREMISRPGIVPLVLFIFFYKMGEAFTTSTSGIMMPFLIQELGFSLSTIAYVNKIMGITSIVLGGLIAGVLLMRWSLYKALLIFGLLQAITNIFFIRLAVVGAHLPTFILAVVSDNFMAGMASTALVVLFMRMVDLRFTASQFSILVVFSTLPRVFSGPLGSFFQSVWGWVGLYEIAFVLSLLFIPFLFIIRNQMSEFSSVCVE